MNETIATVIMWTTNAIAAGIFLFIAGLMAYWSYRFAEALLMDLKIIKKKRHLDQYEVREIWWDQ